MPSIQRASLSRRPSVDDLTLRAQAMMIRLLVELLQRSCGNMGDNGGDALELVNEIEEAVR